MPNRQRRLRGRRVLRPRRRRGKTRTGTIRGGAQNRIWRGERRGYAAPNPSKINGSIFIILGSAARPTQRARGQSGKQPGGRRTPPKNQRERAQNNTAPSPAGLFCVSPSPSIINMYLFFHFNLDCGAEQLLPCSPRVGRGRIIRPRRVGGMACVCA